MTLVLFDGFDNYSAMPKPWTSRSGAPFSAAGRDGSTNGAVQFESSDWVIISLLSSPTATCITGEAFKLINGPGIRQRLMTWMTPDGTQQMVLVPNAGGFLELRLVSESGTLLATSSGHAALTAGPWYSLQAKAVLHTSAGSCVVKLEGQTVINYSGVTSAASGSVGYLLMGQTSTSADWTLDDLWVCDAVDATVTQGRPNNDFLGDLRVITLVPTGAGDTTTWTPSTGSNWATLDENPPVTTDYVSRSAGSAGDRDLYTATDLPGAALSVLGYQSHAFIVKDDIGQANLKQIIKENSTITNLGAGPVPFGNVTLAAPLITKRPSDGTMLTVADINGIQIGVEVA